MGRRLAELPDRCRFAELKSAPYKRWVELGEGTHTVMPEKSRMQFINEVVQFLEEGRPQALN